MKTVDDLINQGVTGRTVLVRADLNVPLDGTTITDDGRVRAAVPTLRKLTDAGARVVVAAHLGRPEGGPDPALSLAPVAARLGELLGIEVPLAGDVVGPQAAEVVAALADGHVALLENVRFDPRETSKSDADRAALAEDFATLVGQRAAFVSDGFGVVHRKQASVYDVATVLPGFTGDLVQAELEVLRTLTGDPARPYVVLLGGAKVSDKLEVIEALLPRVDKLVVGGAMAFTFVVARGGDVGGSLVEEEMVETCARLLRMAGDKLVLPTDVIAADATSGPDTTDAVPIDAVPALWMGLDIGPESVAMFSDVLTEAKTVFWNGPMGVFEMSQFQEGTRRIAQALIDSGAFTVVGGGDSAAAIRTLGLDVGGFSHISTGGGASLEFLEGKDLPGVSILEQDGNG